MKPKVSIVLNTARHSYAMVDMPDVHHLEMTARYLAEQSFDVFEWIVSDYMHDRRLIQDKWPVVEDDGQIRSRTRWADALRSIVPVYHVPVRRNVWTDGGYVAIATCKNSGALYAEGDLLIFLDDCAAPGPDVVKTYWEWFNRGYFATGMHDRYKGKVHVARRDFSKPDHPELPGPTDSRWLYFQEGGPSFLTDIADTYGYMSCSLGAFQKLNGFDEMFDGSRQLEDMDFGRRLLAAGYHLVLDRNLVIREQEHSAINVESRANDREGVPVQTGFRPNLKCNGPWIFMKEDRVGDDRFLANHRGPTSPEWAMMGGDGVECWYRVFDYEGFGYCGKHDPPGGPPRRVPCNWYENKVERNMVLPDSILYRDLKTWSFEEEHEKALKEKARYRVA